MKKLYRKKKRKSSTTGSTLSGLLSPRYEQQASASKDTSAVPHLDLRTTASAEHLCDSSHQFSPHMLARTTDAPPVRTTRLISPRKWTATHPPKFHPDTPPISDYTSTSTTTTTTTTTDLTRPTRSVPKETLHLSMRRNHAGGLGEAVRRRARATVQQESTTTTTSTKNEEEEGDGNSNGNDEKRKEQEGDGDAPSDT